METQNIWHIAREYRGLAEAGGLKDVVRDLSEALAAQEKDVSVILPFYGFMDRIIGTFSAGHRMLQVPFYRDAKPCIESAEIFECRLYGVTIYCIASPFFSDKSAVYTYTHHDSDKDPLHRRGTGHSDAVPMSLFFQNAAVELIRSRGIPPSVIHCHDSHTALIPAIIKTRHDLTDFFADTISIVTIHNAGPGYNQEIHDLDFLSGATGLPMDLLERNMLHGAVNPFLVAGEFAVLNTVSENYAKELLERDDFDFSADLGREFRERSIHISGITNGINPAYLDPRDTAVSGLPASFDPSRNDMAGKRVCREELLIRIRDGRLPPGLSVYGGIDPEDDLPLFVFQARIAYQKGIPLLLESINRVYRDGVNARFLILGQGDQDLEELLIQHSRPDSSGGMVCYIHGYDEEIVKLLFAAGDFFLIPSIYEPCGITDLFALLAGTIPIVHTIGGLVKITDNVTGYTYAPNCTDMLYAAIRRGIYDFYHYPEKLDAMRRNGFSMVLSRYSWEIIVRTEYIPFYESCRVRPVFK